MQDAGGAEIVGCISIEFISTSSMREFITFLVFFFTFDFLVVSGHVKIAQILFSVQLHLKGSSLLEMLQANLIILFLILFLIKDNSSVFNISS